MGVSFVCVASPIVNCDSCTVRHCCTETVSGPCLKRAVQAWRGVARRAIGHRECRAKGVANAVSRKTRFNLWASVRAVRNAYPHGATGFMTKSARGVAGGRELVLPPRFIPACNAVLCEAVS